MLCRRSQVGQAVSHTEGLHARFATQPIIPIPITITITISVAHISSHSYLQDVGAPANDTRLRSLRTPQRPYCEHSHPSLRHRPLTAGTAMASTMTPPHVSALSQQLGRVSSDKPPPQAAPLNLSPKRPSSKRRGKADSNPSSGSEPAAQTPAQPRTKRSPKGTKVNEAKHFSSPSKPTSIPNGQPAAPHTAQSLDLASSHYAGPTFHSSPAPSSLPMPSFLASRTTASSKPTFPIAHEPGSWSPPNQSTPVKPNQPFNGPDFPDQDDSPLGPLFRADREEKNRLRDLNVAETRALGSPTQRPASAGGIPDHFNLHRAESPVAATGAYQRLSTQFEFKSINPQTTFYSCLDHSTSELPLQIDGDFRPLSSHNHLAQRFRSITENQTNHRNARSCYGMPNYATHQSEPRRLSLHSDSRQLATDLESSTQALKSLLSIKATPSYPQPTNPIPTIPPPPSSFSKGHPSPKLIQHNRTRSAVNPIPRGSPPNLNGIQPSRRVFSTSGLPPEADAHPHPQNPPPSSSQPEEGSDEERAIKMEKELRKVLNLS